MTTSAREWRAVREEDIRRAYADKECWNDLDRITWQHPYSFKSIEQWPLDAAVIYKPTDRASVLLGSIKAACSLKDILKTVLVKVTVVVTMCANEMKIQGAPKDWTRHFQQEKVFHIKCQLEDTTLTPPHRWDERIPDLVASCLEVETCLWPTLETVHAGSDQGRIHARALPLLWRRQSKRWGFMCLARRGLRLLCRVAAWEKTFLAPLARSPLCLGGFVETGRFAYRVAHGTQCGGQKLICTTVRLEKLFVANLQDQ